MLRSFASLGLRSLPLLWFVALATATVGFFLVLAGAALAERASPTDSRWSQTQTRGFVGEHR